MKKVLFVASVVKTHIMQFHIPFLKMFKDAGWEVSVAARNDYANASDCSIPYCDHYYDIPFSRSPLSPQNIKAKKELSRIIQKEHFDIIHCHTPVGGVLGRICAKDERKNGTRVIYTAHGFHFFKGSSLKNWIYCPVEIVCSKWTDDLITINSEDYKFAKKKMHAKHIEYVPSVGIDIDSFKNFAIDKEEKCKEIGVPADAYIILSVGELVANKNHKAVVKAISQLNDKNIHYVIAGDGVLKKELQQYIASFGLQDNVHLIGYRKDLKELYKIADLFVHPSFREGLPVALMEAMASGVTTIASDIRGNTELLVHEYLFNPKDSAEIAEQIKKAMAGEFKPAALDEKYSIAHVQEIMKDIYHI